MEGVVIGRRPFDDAVSDGDAPPSTFCLPASPTAGDDGGKLPLLDTGQVRSHDAGLDEFKYLDLSV